jgi:hypothetical protein
MLEYHNHVIDCTPTLHRLVWRDQQRYLCGDYSTIKLVATLQLLNLICSYVECHFTRRWTHVVLRLRVLLFADATRLVQSLTKLLFQNITLIHIKLRKSSTSFISHVQFCIQLAILSCKVN